MKTIFSFILIFFCVSFCVSQNKKMITDKGVSTSEKGKITISNPDLEYEVIIFDIGFESWLQTKGKQRGYYDLAFLENKNRIWISDWNSRSRSGDSKYQFIIDYQPSIKYGYEVNYMLYNYLLYWQETNNIRLN